MGFQKITIGIFLPEVCFIANVTFIEIEKLEPEHPTMNSPVGQRVSTPTEKEQCYVLNWVLVNASQ